MHEIGVVRQMLKTVEEFAAENEIDDIVSIVLEIGDLSMIIPKYVEDIYSVIVEGTRFEHTDLVIETVEGQGVCRQCKRTFRTVTLPLEALERREEGGCTVFRPVWRAYLTGAVPVPVPLAGAGEETPCETHYSAGF